MQQIVSGGLDGLLGALCLVIAGDFARRKNDFLYTGFLWVSLAALVGGLNLGGMTEVDPTHRFLTQVSRGPGSFAMGLGLMAAIYGPFRFSRWAAPGLAIVAAAIYHLLWGQRILSTLSLVLGLVLLIGLVLFIVHASRRKPLAALLATVSLVALLLVAFGMELLAPLAGSLQRVDLVHLLLIASYFALWRSVRMVEQ